MTLRIFNTLSQENEIFERFAHELLTKQELDYDQIEAIFAEYGKANPRRFFGVAEQKPSNTDDHVDLPGDDHEKK